MLEYLNSQGTSPLTGVSIQGSLPLILRGSDAPMTNLTDPTRYSLLGIPNGTGNTKASDMIYRGNTSAFPDKKNRQLLSLQYDNLRSTLNVFSSIDFSEGGNTFRDNEITDNDTEWANGNQGEGYYLFPTNSNKNGGWLRPGGAQVANKYVVPTSLHGFFNNLKSAALVLNKTDAIISGTEFGGFDTHSAQGSVTGQHPNLNRGIAWAMYALRKYFTRYADKATWNNVVVITLSEFGRTTIENADLGTDHAEAGVMFVGGGAIKGYGKPGATTGVFGCSPNDPVPWVPGNGGSMFGINQRYLKRIHDYRSVLGEVIRDHLGATPAQLARIIPGYANEAQEHLKDGGTVGSPIDNVSTPLVGEVGIL